MAPGTRCGWASRPSLSRPRTLGAGEGGWRRGASCCTPYIHVASLLLDMLVTDSLLLLAKLDKLLVAGM